MNMSPGSLEGIDDGNAGVVAGSQSPLSNSLSGQPTPRGTPHHSCDVTYLANQLTALRLQVDISDACRTCMVQTHAALM